jgi:UDP-N-acetylglucosamine diphosphorylase/glucosamine-1-phosphate N-acetyltransferase
MLLHDDARARGFEPLATTRPLGEVRAGALLIRERWQQVLGDAPAGCSTAPHLHGFAEFDAPPVLGAGVLPAGQWLVNTRALPSLVRVPDAATLVRVAGRVAAVRVAVPLPLPLAAAVAAHDAAWPAAMGGETVSLDGHWLDDVWDLIGSLAPLLAQDIPVVAAALAIPRWTAERGAPVVVLGTHPVFVAPSAVVEPFTVVDATAGPVLVERDTTIQAFTRVVGPCAIGASCVVTADRIGGSAIGPQCRVHGELSASILLGHANKAHAGFVGHSVLGRWVNLGAGTTTSNLRHSYGPVPLWTPAGRRSSGLQFLGSFLGDHVKTGIGLCLQTGTVIGAGSSLHGAMPPSVVPPFRWGSGAPYAAHDATAFVATAERAMARRQAAWAPATRDWWAALAAAWGADGAGARWERG